MSPLQFQKQLRLQEARRLMLGKAMDAARAAYEVGYESPSQFSREYRRLFGQNAGTRHRAPEGIVGTRWSVRSPTHAAVA